MISKPHYTRKSKTRIDDPGLACLTVPWRYSFLTFSAELCRAIPPVRRNWFGYKTTKKIGPHRLDGGPPNKTHYNLLFVSISGACKHKRIFPVVYTPLLKNISQKQAKPGIIAAFLWDTHISVLDQPSVSWSGLLEIFHDFTNLLPGKVFPGQCFAVLLEDLAGLPRAVVGEA